MRLKHFILAGIVMLCLVIPAMAADTTTLASNDYTDWQLWILSGLLALVLALLSLNSPTSAYDVEIDAIISCMAIPPAIYCAFASFNISRIIGVGVVTIYSQPIVGWAMVIFTLVCFGNTLRILSLHKYFKGEEEKQRGFKR